MQCDADSDNEDRVDDGDDDFGVEPSNEQQEVGGEIWNVGKVLGQPAGFVLSVQQELQTGQNF